MGKNFNEVIEENKVNSQVAHFILYNKGPVLPSLFSVQFSSIQFSSVQFSSIQISSVQFRPVQFSSALDNTFTLTYHYSFQFNSVQFRSVQFRSVQFNSIQFSSIQFSSVQFSCFMPKRTGPKKD